MNLFWKLTAPLSYLLDRIGPPEYDIPPGEKLPLFPPQLLLEPPSAVLNVKPESSKVLTSPGRREMQL